MELVIHSKKYGRHVVIFDECDYDLVMKYKWHFVPTSEGHTPYARTNYKKPNGKKSVMRMHRLIMNASSDQHVDHINNNGLDNRRCNLRVCTPTENMRNRRKFKNSKCEYKGVSKLNNKFIAQIRHFNKLINLGYYSTEHDAALVYNGAAKLLFGSYAQLNEVRW